MIRIRLVRTCVACPEQYDAFVGDTQVGYLRLRRGHFTVECPDARGEIVLEAAPMGDGLFQPEERDVFLACAKRAILAWLVAVHITKGTPLFGGEG